MISVQFARRLLLSITLPLVALTAPMAAGEHTEQTDLRRPNPLLRATVESIADQGPLAVGGVPLASGRLLSAFYAARGFQPVWEREAQVQALLHAVDEGAAEGLQPADYHATTLRRLSKPGYLEGLDPAARLGAELQLSDALLRYTYHVRFGRLDPAAVNRVWNHRQPIPAQTLVQSMGQVVAAQDTQAALRSLVAKPFFYGALERALRDYGNPHPVGDLPPMTQGAKLAQGVREPRVPLLRERLRALGEHRGVDPTDPNVFDADLKASLIGFQRRFGLPANGIANAGTITALNKPFDDRNAEQIRINLERMRWFYDALPADYILVDVAGFMAHVVRDGQIDWSTRVVVGTAKDQTPSFRDEMEHVVFNPTWTVPPSIQKKMRSASSRFKVIDRRTGRAGSGANVSDPRRVSLVQGPGPTNALGRVKFIFPNDQAVYLHDTQSKGLFSQNVRAYSHGCVRVQDPLKLAEVVLNKPSWNQREINRVVSTNKTRYVMLDERLPVLLYYLTAYADEHGKVGFRGDIYGRDKALRQAFKGPASDLRIGFPKVQPLVDPTTQDASPAPARTDAPPTPTRAPRAAPASEPAVESPSSPIQLPRSALIQQDATGPTVTLDGTRVRETAGPTAGSPGTSL